jgi:hypothetical protein
MNRITTTITDFVTNCDETNYDQTIGNHPWLPKAKTDPAIERNEPAQPIGEEFVRLIRRRASHSDAAPITQAPELGVMPTVPLTSHPGAVPLTEPTVEQPTPPAATNDLGSVVDRLASMGSAGRRAAQRLLEEKANLTLGAERRADDAAEREARADARRARISALAPTVVYTLAIGFALGGQVTTIIEKIEPKDAITKALAALAGVGAAGLIEGAGLAFAALARRGQLAGRSALGARVMMWLCALVACAINTWGHWGTVWVYPCALGSIVALLLWVHDTAERCADALAEVRAIARREEAIRALTRDAVRATHGKKIAEIVATTMQTADLDTLAVGVVDPTTVARAAIGRYLAEHDRTTERERGWRFGRRASVQPADTDTQRALPSERAPLAIAPSEHTPEPASTEPSEQKRASEARGEHSTERGPRKSGEHDRPEPTRPAPSTALVVRPRAESEPSDAERAGSIPDDAREWIAARLEASDAITGSRVAERYKVHPTTGRRWLRSLREDLALAASGQERS